MAAEWKQRNRLVAAFIAEVQLVLATGPGSNRRAGNNTPLGIRIGS